MELLIPTIKFVEFVENSTNYLNCPKHIFNHWLDCTFRQFHEQGSDVQVQKICEFLRQCKYEKPLSAAKKFVEERENISTKEFSKLNVNSYIDKLPVHIEHKHKRINAWYDANEKETWRSGVLIYKTQPSYPYRTIFK